MLGYKNTRDAISKHCKNQNTVAIHDGTSGNPNLTIINQADVIRLATKPKLPAVEKFEKWVFEDVLLTILKTGSHHANPSQVRANILADRRCLILFEAW
ncbi:BRO-N domain-containing protein [Algoriphagus marinus]|uniref:BRO-N domain-containing protein n=1 Tax=Algoriphagus marinus TaxID=1925762 RepID=UPI00373FD132